ncbi:tetratricopeptide repeat protein [Candidatus Nitrospira bockiana]
MSRPTSAASRPPERSLRVLGAVCVLLLLGACASEEKMQMAKGHYQEGLAFLDGDRQQAFVAFQKAIQLNPKHKESHYSLGHLYALQGKYPQAEESFREALRIDPDYSEAHNYLGQVLERQQRWPEAIQEYRRALANPLYATPDKAWFNLGRALAHEGDIENAAQAFEDALLISPASVPAAVLNLELGRVYSRLGYQAKARETLARVQALDKGGQYAAEAGRLMERLKP